MTTPRATVIMRTRNVDWVVGQALAALFSQHWSDFELLVVDSGSTDRTLELLQAYPHRRMPIEASDYYPGRVLNRAIADTHTELVVFQNADSVPLGPHALGRLVAAFDDPGVDAALARQVPRPDAHTWVRRDYGASFPDAPRPPPWITLSLPLAAMRRSAWERHPFYEDAWGSEDTEWGAWATRHGLRIAYVRDAVVMHSHNYGLRQLYGRRFIEGEADAFIYRARETLAAAALQAAAATARDWLADLRAGDLGDLVRAPARRAVFHWAHLRGHRHGAGRIARGDSDASLGQRTVLDRHESNRKP